MPGTEAREAAWDAQSAMAAAADGNEELIVALLDYYKFFDSFEPRFYARFLDDMGIHQQFVDLFLDLNTKAIRRVKISGVYSEGFTTFNALGQGDPVTLMLALLYVTVHPNWCSWQSVKKPRNGQRVSSSGDMNQRSWTTLFLWETPSPR